ncbi:uncharacterized protein LOC123704531 [Colias croceus]|uniref:uncharacterized protein LOC123704531 n=1 Tax=Colias crocea TaxID=72248 RepID=UPI001E27AD78|nr:uncharacterized protein LOC123704531 [Colias croceus]
MKGVKYVYKRDFFWRTWRLINNTNNTVICYKCNSFNSSSSQCGYWVIEEKPPPCPHEIFSLTDSKTLCVVNYTGFHNASQSCPSKIHLEELLETCNNPIMTKWRIQRNYSAADQSAIDVCQGSESCEMTTIYTINKDSIIFRLINSTNHIFYSRVMKSGNKNYACDEDCGYFNPLTQAIRKNNQHLVLNLLNYNLKNKREDIISKKIVNKSKINDPLKKSVFKYGLHYKQVSKKQYTDKKPNIVNNSKSLCKILQDSYLDVKENYSDYDF